MLSKTFFITKSEIGTTQSVSPKLFNSIIYMIFSNHIDLFSLPSFIRTELEKYRRDM